MIASHLGHSDIDSANPKRVQTHQYGVKPLVSPNAMRRSNLSKTGKMLVTRQQNTPTEMQPMSRLSLSLDREYAPNIQIDEH